MILKHFKAYELVPKSIYEAEGESAVNHLTPAVQYSLEHVHDFFSAHYVGKVVVIVNSWFWGGNNQYRGFRPSDCGIGAKDSEHKRGNAIDFDVLVDKKKIPAEDVRKLIVGHRDQFPFITRMETGVDWVHIDCKPLPIVLFKP